MFESRARYSGHPKSNKIVAAKVILKEIAHRINSDK
jgi:hypothetical protein